MNRICALVVITLLAVVACCSGQVVDKEEDDLPRSPLMRTNIALVGLDPETTDLHKLGSAVIDTSTLLEKANLQPVTDIEEDEDDPFITNRKGGLRPKYYLGEEEEKWDEEEPMPSLGKVLKRVKRCGGGGDDDDGANRARRARRRRARRARAARRAAREAERRAKTTTVTRKVIQNGQVVSHTVESVQAGTGTVQSDCNNQQQVAQPVIIQQSPQPIVQAAPQAVVQAQTPALVGPQVVQTITGPTQPNTNVSIQGSINMQAGTK